MNLVSTHRGSLNGKTSAMLVRILLVLAMVAMTAAPALAGRHTITSLPYTFRSNMHSGDAVDTLVLAGTRLNASGNGILLQSDYGNPLHGVLLDLGNDTLAFGMGGGNGAYGVRLSGNNSYQCYDIEIRGGHILHASPDTTADGCRAIWANGHDILINDVHATVMGFNGIVFYSSGQYTYDNRIVNGRFRSYVTGYNSRCNYDAVVVKFHDMYSTAISDNNADYHWEVSGLTIENGPHMGIAALGREGHDHYAKVEIHHCNITTDARNDFYTSNSGTCLSSSNPYGIAVRHAHAGTKIYNNTITSGTQLGGNRGIIIEYGNGTSSEPVEIYNNYIDVHEGPNVEYGDRLPVHGMRIRYSPRNIHVYDNTFICTGDNDPSTTHIGSNIIPFRYSWKINNTGNVFERNTIRAQALEPGVDATSFIVEGDDIAGPPQDPTLTIRYNRIEGTGTLIKWGDGNGGAPGVGFHGDTLVFLSPSYSPQTFHVGHGGNNWDCADNSVRDMVYLNGTADNDIEIANGGTLELAVERTLNITVLGANDLPVPSAGVSVTNNYGRTVLSGVTGAGGTLAGSVTYLFQSRGYDSSAYNDFTIKTWKAGDSVTETFTVSATQAAPEIIMPTIGTPDTIPPDPVLDLGGVGGSSDGTIILSWTAPGEDGDQGIAAVYEIRYSTSPITAGNWLSATQVPNTPKPDIAGTQQGMTISGLTPGTWYYMGIKTIDINDNPSDLSNIAEAEARLNFITGDDDVLVSLAAPDGDSVVNSSRPTLVVVNSGAAGDNYFFEVAADSGFVALAAASDAVPQESGTTTAWQVNNTLQAGGRYYWRARLNDGPYSAAANFMVEPKTHAYPNPFVLSNGDVVTFTEIPEGSSLLVMTMSGDIVRRWVNLANSELQWNGTNDSGNPVASGTYLWYIEDTDVNGKLVVVR